MASVINDVKIDTRSIRNILKGLKKLTSDQKIPRKTVQELVPVIVKVNERSFATQRSALDGSAWAKLSPLTVLRKKSMGFSGGKKSMLIRTGDLKAAALNPDVDFSAGAGQAKALLNYDLPEYGAVQQFGSAGHQKGAGKVYTKGSHAITVFASSGGIPARPFIGFLSDGINGEADKEMEKVLDISADDYVQMIMDGEDPKAASFEGKVKLAGYTNEGGFIRGASKTHRTSGGHLKTKVQVGKGKQEIHYFDKAGNITHKETVNLNEYNYRGHSHSKYLASDVARQDRFAQHVENVNNLSGPELRTFLGKRGSIQQRRGMTNAAVGKGLISKAKASEVHLYLRQLGQNGKTKAGPTYSRRSVKVFGKSTRVSATKPEYKAANVARAKVTYTRKFKPSSTAKFAGNRKQMGRRPAGGLGTKLALKSLQQKFATAEPQHLVKLMVKTPPHMRVHMQKVSVTKKP